MCGQYKAWCVGRPGGYEKRGGGEVAEDGQAESKEAEIKIVENICLSALIVLYVLIYSNHALYIGAFVVNIMVFI